MGRIDCNEIAKELRDENRIEIKKKALKQAEESQDLWEKCVLLRKFTSPQSTDAEKLIKLNLEIDDALDNISGDGIKNDIKYEIKVSLHDLRCKVNIRQIRPHHDIDFYIIVAFNLFRGVRGQAHIFKIPSKIIYELIAEFGGYTHGTVAKNGIITEISVLGNKNKSFEYSLSPDPNSQLYTKSNDLWREFLKYEVAFDKKHF